MIIKKTTKSFLMFLLLFAVSAVSSKAESGTLTKITKKGYTLSFVKPEGFAASSCEDGRIEYKVSGCTFISMLILYKKNIPRWAYYKERLDYQDFRVRKGISKILAGNSTLGGNLKTYYYLKEMRIDKKKREKTYLIFFEKFIDTIGGKYNVLVKSVVRSNTLEAVNKNINTGAFIFRSFSVSYDENYRED